MAAAIEVEAQQSGARAGRGGGVGGGGCGVSEGRRGTTRGAYRRKVWRFPRACVRGKLRATLLTLSVLRNR